MTTDNRTNEPTPEQILVDEWIRQADRAKSMTGIDAIWFPDAEETLAILRANGLLFEGTPSEAQVEAAAKALASREPMRSATAWENLHEFERKHHRDDSRAALTAAGVAPQEPNQNETKSGNNFVSLDPEKMAEVMLDAETALEDLPGSYGIAKGLARALCEAYKEGKLTK